ncbi:DNA-binding transcriptional regulator ume6 [Stygiomarasmius scandens]|uniref:DNA-binding transcriptional regulator ume6 n=1 Tax=Marasmiellus scandens TaxID=2682957 RepID=A0ABR1JP87_9AGAR
MDMDYNTNIVVDLAGLRLDSSTNEQAPESPLSDTPTLDDQACGPAFDIRGQSNSYVSNDYGFETTFKGLSLSDAESLQSDVLYLDDETIYPDVANPSELTSLYPTTYNGDSYNSASICSSFSRLYFSSPDYTCQEGYSENSSFPESSWNPTQSSSYGPLYHAQFSETHDSRFDFSSNEIMPLCPMLTPDWSAPLLQNYIDHVYRMQYLLADTNKLFGIIYNSVINGGVAREAAVLLSAIHLEGGRFALTRNGPTKNRYIELSNTCRLVPPQAYNKDHAMTALHVISAFLFDGGQGDWETWMEIAIVYVRSILENRFRFHDYRDALLTCSEEENFVIKTVFWFDVIAAVTTIRPPRLQDVITYIYSPYNQSEIHDTDSGLFNGHKEKLSMMKVMGCENRILWALSEVSALADWKQRQAREGQLSYTNLVRRANVLEVSLETPSRQTFSESDNTNEDARYYVSEIFRTAAIVYLRTVVSNDFWRVSDVEIAVKSCIDAFRSFNEHQDDMRHAVVRSTVFAVFLCGCFTSVARDWKVLEEFLSGEGSVGNCNYALELAKTVRAQRKKTQPVRWREALNEARFLLV